MSVHLSGSGGGEYSDVFFPPYQTPIELGFSLGFSRVWDSVVCVEVYFLPPGQEAKSVFIWFTFIAITFHLEVGGTTVGIGDTVSKFCSFLFF